MPIFLTFRDNGFIGQFSADWMASHEPIYDFVAADGISHTVWKIGDTDTIAELEKYFDTVPAFYIADGHHRSASAVRVGLKRRAEHPDYDGTEEFNFFLSVLFPSDVLHIFDYNRVVHDLNGLTEKEFLAKVGVSFDVVPMAEMPVDKAADTEFLEQYRPAKKHDVSMYIAGRWYKLTAKTGTFNETDPVSRLDVSILQKNLLTPVLAIGDPRTDSRISFIGGIRGLKELVKLVDGGCAVAFAMYPTTLDDLMDIADAGAIMPPKSTWFEPKLRSGLFVHYLD